MYAPLIDCMQCLLNVVCLHHIVLCIRCKQNGGRCMSWLCRSTRQDVFNIAGAMYAAVLFLGYGIPACILLCKNLRKIDSQRATPLLECFINGSS